MIERLDSASRRLIELSLDRIRIAWENHWFGLTGSPNHMAVGWLITEIDRLMIQVGEMEEINNRLRHHEKENERLRGELEEWRSLALTNYDAGKEGWDLAAGLYATIATLREVLKKIDKEAAWLATGTYNSAAFRCMYSIRKLVKEAIAVTEE